MSGRFAWVRGARVGVVGVGLGVSLGVGLGASYFSVLPFPFAAST